MYCKHCKQEVKPNTTHRCNAGSFNVPASVKDDDGDFLLSMAIGAATDSAIIGGMLGGSTSGGILGDMLDGDLFD